MYAVLNMGYTPSQFANLPQREKAFIIASIKLKLDEEKKQAQKIKNTSTGRRKK